MGGRSLHPFCEPVVVLVQLLQALLRGELDADANVRSGPVEPFDLEALEDPQMQVHLVGRISLTIVWGHQDQIRIKLLRLSEQDL